MGVLNKLKEYFGFRKPKDNETPEKSTKDENNSKKLEGKNTKFEETKGVLKDKAANFPELGPFRDQ